MSSYELDDELVTEFCRHTFADNSVSDAMVEALEAATTKAPSDGNRVILVKQGETLIVAVETTPFYEGSMATIGAWFKAIGIDVLFVNGINLTIGKTPFHPCEHGNQMGECVLENGHEQREGDGPGMPGPGPCHVDRAGRNWGVSAG